MASKIPEIFDIFGPQLNTFMIIGHLLDYFRPRKLLQSKWGKTVSNLDMAPLYITNQVGFPRFLLQECYSTINFTYNEH